MSKRPELSKEMDSKVFQQYYYLKEELVAFCRQMGLPTSGGKIELTKRISHYLETGEILASRKTQRPRTTVKEITDDTIIESNIVCSEIHRAYFKQRIGKQFSFKVAFQQWLKENAGKTYKDAIEAYTRIIEESKRNKPSIDQQFEYNTYIRDFFADNKGRTLEDAITCWKYKKSCEGHNRYEPTDINILKEGS